MLDMQETVPEPVDAEVLGEIRTRLMGAAFTLIGIGLVLVYSASAVRHGGWEFDLLVRQVRWLVIGLVGFGAIVAIGHDRLRRAWPLVLLVTIGLLVAVRIPGVGTRVRGAYRWLRVGGFNMQPSELAKLSMVLVLASLLGGMERDKLRFYREVLPVSVLIGLSTGLVVIEPDFGTAALLAGVLVAMLLAGGASFWHVMLFGLAGAPGVLYYGLTKFDHITARVDAWWQGATDGAGWQPWMSQVALGSGGLTGVGSGQGAAKLYFLPDAHTDFIYAILGQEFGIAGTMLVLSIFCFFVVEGMRLVRYAPDRFGALLAFGIVLQIGFQAAFNIAVVTATIPPKGISLPFVSFGGSGLCVSLAGLAMLVSITRRVPQAAEVEIKESVQLDVEDGSLLSGMFEGERAEMA